MKPPPGQQVVGLDGSAGAAHALQWAHAHVGIFGAIRPVVAWQRPWWELIPTTVPKPPGYANAEHRGRAWRLLNRMLTRVPRGDLLEPFVVHGRAGPTLTEVAGPGSLIVVGTRGSGAVQSGLLGSVSSYCVSHATGPVAVIPATSEPRGPFERALVGVDGSDHSTQALTWIVEHAQSHTVLDVMYAWEPTSTVVATTERLADDELASQAQGLVAEVADAALRAAGRPEQPVSVSAVCGDPREVLRSRAATADLLVVGARGRRGVSPACHSGRWRRQWFTIPRSRRSWCGEAPLRRSVPLASPSGDQRPCRSGRRSTGMGRMSSNGAPPETVADVMTTDLLAVLPADRIGRVRDLMLTVSIHAVPVMDGNDVLGIVTSTDLIDDWPDDEPLSTIMSPVPTAISHEASIQEAAELMLADRIHHLLVTDEREVIGILSSLDLLAALTGGT